MIAIFGNPKDPHAQEICNKINALGHDCTIISTTRCSLKNTNFIFSHNQGQPSTIKINQGSTTILIDDVRAALVLQPIFPLFSTTAQEFSQELKFWFFTWRESMEGIYAVLERNGVLLNHSVSNAMAHQNKIRYISAPLTRLLKQPKTIISNNRETLLKFFESSHQPVILKTLHQMQLSLDGEPTMLLASLVQHDDFVDFGKTNECPVFLQEYIEKIYDVRLTIVGNQIFTCKIDATQSDAGRVDWRAYDLANTPHTPYFLPKNIAEEIINICTQLTIDYATIDICVNHKGEYYLLDINPFGKYLWIEHAIGTPITDAIARFLIKKSVQSHQIM
jgi:glutathione synthase/RimK-type ligase-like ATP-grasp enzyme